MKSITSLDEFKREKRRLVDKWGDQLLLGDAATVKQIHKDCEALARFAKLPVERLHTALATDYVNRGGEIRKV